MFPSTGRNFVCESQPTHNAAVSPAAGLIVLGLTILLFSLHHSALLPFGTAALGIVLFYGALGQIGLGLAQWKKRDAFGAVLGIAFGLFWLSQIAMVVLPETGIGRAPQAAGTSSYLAMWGLFTAILFAGSSRLGREMRIFLGMLGLFLLLLSAGAAAESSLITAVAGGEGIVCGAAGIVAGIVRLRD